MDTIKYFLNVTIKIAVFLLIISLVLWILRLLYPDLTLRSLLPDYKGVSFNILPPPRNVMLTPRKPDGNSNVHVYTGSIPYSDTKFVPPPGGNSDGVEYVYYTSSGTYIYGSGSSATNTGPYRNNDPIFTKRANHVRNLSIYDRIHMTYGHTFIGEARDPMFKNGKFKIYIMDSKGRLVAETDAEKFGTWSIPGWTRFQATIRHRLPRNEPCVIIFQSAQQPFVQAGMRITCNG